MISGWIVYFILMLTALKGAFILIACLVLVGSVGGFLTYFIEGSENEYASACLKWSKRGLGVFLVCGLWGLFLPTTKQVAAIYLIPKVVNSNAAPELTQNALRLWENAAGR